MRPGFILASLVAIALAACGGKQYREACTGAEKGDQLCTPPNAAPFCCADNMACGTGPLESGGNGCALDACCPSPVADGGTE